VSERPSLALDDPALARGFSSLGARLVPLGVHPAHETVDADVLPLAGGPLAFDRLRVVFRDGDGSAEALGSIADVRDWAANTGDVAAMTAALEALIVPRPRLAGLTGEGPFIAGVLNVTPDSFADGGRYDDHGTAIAHGMAMIEAGAHLIDVGGESTRPGADPVTAVEQCRRVLPVVDALAPHAPVSIDTCDADVMRAALDAGARIVNDVSALTRDAGALDVVATAGCPVILMHSRGQPKTMQDRPTYADVRLDIVDYLEARIAACVAAGIGHDRIVVDPGIGFGQDDGHIALLLRDLAMLHGLGCPVMLGASRKSFIGRLDDGASADDRLPGSIATALHGVSRGVQFLRVHDVAETRQALRIWAHAGNR